MHARQKRKLTGEQNSTIPGITLSNSHMIVEEFPDYFISVLHGSQIATVASNACQDANCEALFVFSCYQIAHLALVAGHGELIYALVRNGRRRLRKHSVR